MTSRTSAARSGLAAIGVVRIAIGVTAMTRPQLLRIATRGRPLGPRATALTRMVGARDAAIGVGTVVASSSLSPSALRTFAAAGAAADVGDAVACLVAARAVRPRRRLGWLAMAGSGALGAAATVALLALEDA
jgi:hypothetical protein